MNMITTFERVLQVKQRAQTKKREKEKRFISTLSCLSLLLFLFLVSSLGKLTGTGGAMVQGMNGATMMLEGAGGYVLVGIVAFIAAVAITELCIRYHEKSKNKNINSQEDEKK